VSCHTKWNLGLTNRPIDQPTKQATCRVACVVDCRRGQSLVVHAINEGRQAARQIDIDLMGRTSLAFTGGVVTSTRTAEDLWSRPVQYDIDTV